MADWMDELVQKAKQKYDDQRTQDKKYVIEDEQKKAAGKRFMETFSTTLQKSVNDFNTRMGGERIISVEDRGDTVLIVANLTRRDIRTMEVTYSEPLFSVSISNRHSATPYHYQLEMVGGIAMMKKMEFEGGHIPPVQISAFKLVEFVLSKLLNGE
ncbi:MAG: hypothetical protein ABSD98_02430 [Candidatus Korobacteraceae bacterium]|jgi:hypothetical protein